VASERMVCVNCMKKLDEITRSFVVKAKWDDLEQLYLPSEEGGQGSGMLIDTCPCCGAEVIEERRYAKGKAEEERRMFQA
jgi:hypothetical protein